MTQRHHRHQHDRPRHHEHAHAAYQENRTSRVTAVTPPTEIIEIPDTDSEEDSDVPPPPQIRRKVRVPTETHSASSSAIDLTASDDSDSPQPVRRGRLHQHKRPKIHHPPSDEPIRTVKREAPINGFRKDERLGDFLEYPKVQVSFPNRNRGDDRATLSFRTAPQPEPQRSPRRTSIKAKVAELAKARAERQAANRCPYYFDQKLNLKMYRGPGYEQFPVVLGSVVGHTEICDQWDANEKERLRKEEALEDNLRYGSLMDDELEPVAYRGILVHEAKEDEKRCLEEVLQIFPQIQHNFVLEKYQNKLARVNASHDGELLEFPTPADIVAEIAELDSYPSEIPLKGKEKEEKPQDGTLGKTVVWRKDILKNSMYYKEAIILLAREFDHVPTHNIYRLVHEKGALFESYLYLRDAEDAYYTRRSKPYARSKRPREELEKKYQAGPRDHREGHQYVSLVNELQAAKQHVARQALKAEKQKEKEEQEATNLAIHQAEGSLIECQCCFDGEIPINRAVCCEGDEAHFFCFSCVAQLAETQIGLMKGEMRCMDGSGCKVILSTEGVGQAVSIKIFDKLAFNQQQVEISAAGIEGLEQCPFCDFKAIYDPVEVNSVFSCLNPECGRVTCRKCNEETHLPQSCAEAKADKGLSARHLVEEARSEAMMRTCPKCKVKIVKELGCNKMRCTTCGCLMCYVCKADISTGKENGYEHFNRSGAKCKLYDETGVDRHVVEADDAERAAIKKAREENADVDEEKLRVDTKKGDDGRHKSKEHARPVQHHHRGFDAQEAMNIMADAMLRVNQAHHMPLYPPPAPPPGFLPGLGLGPGLNFDANMHPAAHDAGLRQFREDRRQEAVREHQRLHEEALQRMNRVRQLNAQQRANIPPGRYLPGGYGGVGGMAPGLGALDQAVRGLEAGVWGLEQGMDGGRPQGWYGNDWGRVQGGNRRHPIQLDGMAAGDDFLDERNPGFEFGGVPDPMLARWLGGLNE